MLLGMCWEGDQSVQSTKLMHAAARTGMQCVRPWDQLAHQGLACGCETIAACRDCLRQGEHLVGVQTGGWSCAALQRPRLAASTLWTRFQLRSGTQV